MATKTFKVGLGAGHNLFTIGKNCPKALDPNMTKEWVLNNRIVTKMQKLLSEYKDIEVLRVDDPEGIQEQSFTEKRKEWDAVGLLGKLHVNDDGSCIVGGYAKVVANGVLTASDVKTNMRVMKRITSDIVLVMLK